MSFLRHPRQVRARKLLFLFHLWAGLIIGFFLMVVGTTGSILVFSDDIQKRSAVHIEAARTGTPLGIVERARIAHTRFPDVQLSYISFSASPGEPASVSSQDPVTATATFSFIRRPGKF